MKLQKHVIWAVFRRDLLSYFSNPIGYLFITAFVWASAYLAFWHNDAFFAANLADLDQLNRYFHFVLLILVPAITMNAWAEERKTGTEELLLTLPASDLEIVFGKYLSSLAIYTVALVFSGSNILWLMYLGDPDWGLMFSTYFGYWLVGAALLSAGMMASLLTANVTVAFILGVAVCLLLVATQYFGALLGIFPSGLVNVWNSLVGLLGIAAHDPLAEVSIGRQLEPFGKGLVSLGGIFYFASIVVVMLYLNMVLLGRRHWGGSAEAGRQWGHSLVRAASLAAGAACITLLTDRAEAKFKYLKIDATEEQIHDLSDDTIAILDAIDPNSPVIIEAFVSATVPKDYAKLRRDLLDTLRRVDSLGGNRVVVNLHDNVELFSEEARRAERVYNIKAEPVPTAEDGRYTRQDVFLGVAFKSGPNEKTIPFFYRGLPVEYELMRLIRTVSERKKTKIGVLNTDASWFGTFNFQAMQPGQDWQIVGELRQQYDVVSVNPDTPIITKADVKVKELVKERLEAEEAKVVPDAKLADLGAAGEKLDRLRDALNREFDLSLTDAQIKELGTLAKLTEYVEANRRAIKVLIVPMASSLTQTQLDNLLEYIKEGRPTLIFDDPMPLENPRLAAREQKNANRNPMMGQQAPPIPKGNLRQLTDLLNLGFDTGNVVWQKWNPHPQFQDLPEECVFIGTGSGNSDAFNRDHLTTSGLQEVVLFFPGAIRRLGGESPEFTPLLRTGRLTGTTPWNDIFTESFLSMRSFNERPKRRLVGSEFVIAAHVQGPVKSDSSGDGNGNGDSAKDKASTADAKVNVIFVSDLDIISDQFFQLRRRGEESLHFDNIGFVLNCVDLLAGDESFVELRKKRAKRRTLERLVQMTQDVAEQASKDREAAEEESRKELDRAQNELNDAVDKIQKREDLDPRTKAAMIELNRRTLQAKLEKRRIEIEQARDDKKRQIEAELQREIRSLQRGIKLLAVLTPPIPALVVAGFVFFARRKGEREGVDPRRLV